MKVMYYATDGTIFEDQDECIIYEASKLGEDIDVIFRNATDTNISLRDLIAYGFDQACSVKFATLNDKVKFCEFADKNEVYFGGDNERFYYDEDENELSYFYDLEIDEWVGVNTRRQELKNKLEEFEERFCL